MAKPWAGCARYLLAAVVGILGRQTAQGFYFPGWPGGPKPPATLLTPPPVNGPPKSTPDPPHPPGDGGHEEPPVRSPEPGTAVLAALGLGVAVAAKRRRRPQT